MEKIVLASQSPRRKQLLEWAEVEFDVIAKQTDELSPAGLEPEQTAIYIARQKALAAQGSDIFGRYESNPIILAADTLVLLGDQVIGKPEDRKDAIRILRLLSGKKHQVITGVVLLDRKEEISFADITEVWFRELTIDQIEYYVDKYKPFDKAGAYAIQEWIGVIGVRSITGDFFNVMGLPVSRVLVALDQMSNQD